MMQRPLDLLEKDLLALLESAIEQNVFTPDFLGGLKALLDHTAVLKRV